MTYAPSVASRGASKKVLPTGTSVSRVAAKNLKALPQTGSKMFSFVVDPPLCAPMSEEEDELQTNCFSGYECS